MKSLLLSGFFGVLLLLLQSSAAYAQVPTSNLKLHLTANAGITTSGDSVNVWADQSGNGNDAVQTNLARRPVLVTNSLNGEPVIHFNGVNSYLTLPTASDLGIQSNDYEIFIVSRSASVNTNTSFLLAGNLERYELHLNGSAGARFIPKASTYIDEGAVGDYSDTEPHLYNLRATDTYGSVTVDFTNSTQSNVDVQSSDAGNLYLGVRFNNSYTLNGDIAEVLIYNTVLSSASRDSVESYLNGKYVIDPSADSISISFASLEGNGESGALLKAVVDAPFNTSYRVLWGTNKTAFTDSTSLIVGGPGSSRDTLSIDVTGLNTNTLYYAQLKAISDYETVTSSIIPFYYQNSLIASDSLSVWLAADIGLENKLNGDTLSTWYDISGNLNNAFVPPSNNEPSITTNAINGLPVISLGSSGAFNLPTTSEMGIHNRDYEIFIVAKKNGIDGSTLIGEYNNFSFSLDHNGYAFRFTDFDNFGSNGEGGDLSIGEEGYYSDNNPYVFNLLGSNQSGYVNIDYLTVGTDTSNSFWMRNDNALGLGAGLFNGSRFNYFKGDIAEVIIYRRTLSATERYDVHAYLSDKYGLDLPLSTPTQSVSDLSIASSGAGSLKITFSPGNGVNNLVLMKQGAPVDALPVDDNSYPASAIFGEGDEIGSGNYVVSNDTDTSVVITGLTEGLTYYARVFSFNGAPGSSSEKYNTADIDTISMETPVVILVNSVSPAPFSNSSKLNDTITITFSSAMNAASFVTDSSFIVRGSESGLHTGMFEFSAGNEIVTFTADSSFKAGERVVVNITKNLEGSTDFFDDAQVFAFNIRTSGSTANFQKRGSLKQDFNSYKTEISDINSDGLSDMIMLDKNNYLVSVRLGDSDSTFSSSEDFSSGDYPTNFAIADIDGDGDEDILVTNDDSDYIKVMYNDGDGEFETSTNFSLNNYSYSVSTGDLDHDGDLDVVVGIYDYISVLINDGTGALSSPTDYLIDASESVAEVSVLDTDGDGDLDIIATTDNEAQLYSLINKGDGTFEAPTELGSVDNPESLVTGDIDNDGDVDLIFSSDGNNYFYVYKNNGDGTFASSVQYETEGYIYDLKLVDFDGDGDLDVIGSENDYDIHFYLNQGDGTYPSYSTLNVNSIVYSIGVSDWDEDGDVDLFAVTSDSIYIYENVSFSPLTIAGSEGWRLVSSPLGNTAFSDMFPGIWTQGFAGATSTSGNSNLYLWDESSTDEDTTNWVSASSMDDSLRMGSGALIYIFSDDNGPLEEGDSGFPKSLEFLGFYSPGTSYIALDSLLNPNENGWALLGNPFFVDIDWDDFYSSDLSQSVYVWDAEGSDWNEWNGDSGDLTDGIIHPYTAFFVQTTGSDPEPELEIEVPSGYDLQSSSGGEGGEKALFSKSISFSVKLENESGLFDNTWLQFSEDAETGIDDKDAFTLAPLSSSYVSFGSSLADGTLLSINNQPVGKGKYEYPLSVNTTETGKHQISIDQLSIPEGWEVSLRDIKTDVVTNLASPYVFTMESTDSKANISQTVVPKIRKMAKSKTFSRFILTISAPTVNGEPVSDLPRVVELEQNYPNPFNPSSVIQFGVPKTSRVNLEVFDLLGRKVATLVNNENRQAGRYSVQFDGRNLASGLYIYRLQVGNTILTKKMTLIK